MSIRVIHIKKYRKNIQKRGTFQEMIEDFKFNLMVYYFWGSLLS